jgi:hypothetical protein
MNRLSLSHSVIGEPSVPGVSGASFGGRGIAENKRKTTSDKNPSGWNVKTLTVAATSRLLIKTARFQRVYRRVSSFQVSHFIKANRLVDGIDALPLRALQTLSERTKEKIHDIFG